MQLAFLFWHSWITVSFWHSSTSTSHLLPFQPVLQTQPMTLSHLLAPVLQSHSLVQFSPYVPAPHSKGQEVRACLVTPSDSEVCSLHVPPRERNIHSQSINDLRIFFLIKVFKSYHPIHKGTKCCQTPFEVVSICVSLIICR